MSAGYPTPLRRHSISTLITIVSGDDRIGKEEVMEQSKDCDAEFAGITTA